MAVHLPHLRVPLWSWHRSAQTGPRPGSREDLAARLTVTTAELLAARAVLDQQAVQLARAASAARLAAAEHAMAVAVMQATAAAAARGDVDPVVFVRDHLRDRLLHPRPGADPVRVLAAGQRAPR